MAPLLLANSALLRAPAQTKSKDLIQAAFGTDNMNHGLVPAGFFALSVLDGAAIRDFTWTGGFQT
jgi:hypothetical protein